MQKDEAAALREACKTSDRWAPNVCHASVYGMHGVRGGASVCAGFIEANPKHPFVLHQKFAFPKPAVIPVKVPKAARPEGA